MSAWCDKWSMKINAKKSQIVHIRNPQRPRSTVKLFCSNQELAFVSNYKYLGYIINEHLSHKTTVDALTTSGNRAFGRIVNIFRSMGNMGYKSYTTLYNTYVMPILNYAAGVWGYQEQAEPQILQNRIERYYLGVNKFTPNAPTRLEMDYMDIKFKRWTEMICYKNRLAKMDQDRLPVKVYRWDKSLKRNGWAKQVKAILDHCSMQECMDIDVLCDTDVLEARLHKLNRDLWRVEATTKPKLRTFILIHDFYEHKIMVHKNLQRNHRSLITKLKCGVLPLNLELGRYKDSPIETRLCYVCNLGVLESEIHFLFQCPGLANIRNEFNGRVVLPRALETIMLEDILKKNLTADYIKEFGSFLEAILY